MNTNCNVDILTNQLSPHSFIRCVAHFFSFYNCIITQDIPNLIIVKTKYYKSPYHAAKSLLHTSLFGHSVCLMCSVSSSWRSYEAKLSFVTQVCYQMSLAVLNSLFPCLSLYQHFACVASFSVCFAY